MKKPPRPGTSEIRLANDNWGPFTKLTLIRLKNLIKRYKLSVTEGDLQYLQQGWYVTHVGLLHLAQRKRCSEINVQQVREFCEPASSHWVFKATVYKRGKSGRFVGYGDADPSNVSPLVRGAEMRVAETRAVNRALRKAYGIGLCSVEELGARPEASSTGGSQRNSNGFHTANGSHGGPTRLRDQLCLLIRQYNLDPTLVKAYAADFSGTQTLKDASRDLVESFISHLSSSAKEDLNGLICKLNSYSQTAEVKP